MLNVQVCRKGIKIISWCRLKYCWFPLIFWYGNFSVFSIFWIMLLGDCTFPKHLETDKFKELRKMHDLPFISALAHFFFPKFPLTSLTKIPSKFLFSSSSYLKEKRTKTMSKNSKYLFQIISGAPKVNFRKISVRKTIWDLEFSEHLL